MKKTYRRGALLVAILLVFAMLFSELFILCESDHDCIGEGCSICAGIAICESFLRQIVLSVVATAVFGAILRYALFDISEIQNPVHSRTPVSLKVKLSN